MQSDRFETLDAIRGGAALIVLIHHCSFYLLSTIHAPEPIEKIFKILVRLGHPAVVVFFVLSGFVLYVQYARSTQFSYRQYIIKRAMRIYPALFAAIGISALLYWITHSPVRSNLGEWFTTVWMTPPTLEHIADHLALRVIEPSDIDLDGAIWSLAYEVRISLIFPLIAFAILRTGFFNQIIAGTTLYLIIENVMSRALNIWPGAILGGSVVGAIVVTFHYIPCFIFGAAAARFSLALGRNAEYPLGRVGECLLLLVIAETFFSQRWELLLDFAAASLLLLAIHGRVTPLLASNQLTRWLGRVSYSLYLVHGPILYAAIYTAHEKIDPMVLTIGVIATSLLMAAFLYRYVEIPGMRIGGWLTARRVRTSGNHVDGQKFVSE